MFRQRPHITAIAMCLIFVLGVTELPCEAAESSGPTGTLRIKGKGVQKLWLVDGGGKSHSVEPNDGLVVLSPSSYTVNQIYLTNGLHGRDARLFKIRSDAETTLEAGGPLTPKIEATRSGCMLVMSCFAEGIGGARYSGSLGPRAGPPAFEIYKGNRKIDDGKFEYG